MTVAISEVGRKGRLDLAFSYRAGRTVLSRSYCEVPFKITRLLDTPIAGTAHLILMQCSAGLFPGDDLECTIHVDKGARVRISQQSATKVHPPGDSVDSMPGKPARQQLRIHVECGAELAVDLEPVIPFAGSRLQQKTSIAVEEGGRLMFWEGFMAGRIGKDERWKFAELSSETRLDLGGHLAYLERFCLDSSKAAIASNWVMKHAGYTGTGLCVDADAKAYAESLHAQLPEAGVDILESSLVVVRTVAEAGPAFHHNRRTFQSVCIPSL